MYWTAGPLPTSKRTSATYAETFYINGQCCLDTDYKEAAIYPCPGDVDLREYVLHEILHVAFAAADNRDREETFIRDLCTII